MSPTPGARRPCPRAYAPWLLSLAATLLLAVGAALAQWDLESILSRAEQRYGELGAAKSRLGDWGRLLEQGGTLDEAAKLRAVNDFFNRSLRFTDDIEIWQQEDYWATPVEALVKGAADCEDYAIAKYVTLRRLGVASDKLRITYVKALRLNQAHMVLTWYASPGADPLVLDNLIGEIRPGYDLKQLFIGAEGTLGIVTRAVLRLEPLQRPGATALLGLPDVDAAITIAARLRREHAERLFACEILWHDYLQCTAAPMGDSAPSLASCPLYLLVELAEDRHLDAGEALTALLEDCFEDGLVEDALLAANETQRLAIWRLREDSDAAIHAGVDSLSFDVSLPVPALAGYVERIRRRLDDLVKGMQVFLFGHFLDGNLHVMLAADVPLLPLHQVVEEILYGELGECAGVISAEHGIGLEKKEALGRYADPLKLALMAQIKELLDPSGLFNPGKVIP